MSPCACSAAGAPPRVSRIHLYICRVGVVPRRCRRGVGRRARLRGKGLQIFYYPSCHDATTHHTMLEDFRSPQQVHPLAVPSRTGIPLKTWGESSGCSRPPNLFTSSTRLVSQQASPPAFVRIPAVRRSAAAAQGMPTTGAFLFRSGSGAGSVDSLPNPLLLPDNASPIFDKPSLSRHCAASASVFPHSRRPINLTWDAYDRYPAFLPFRCLRDGDVSIDTLLNTPLSVEHPLTFPAKPSPLRPCAASKGAFTQTVAAALFNIWNPAREHSSWLLVAKPQCNSIQFNSIQFYYYTSILLYFCQAVAIATPIHKRSTLIDFRCLCHLLFNIWNPVREHSSCIKTTPQFNSIQFNFTTTPLYYYT